MPYMYYDGFVYKQNPDKSRGKRMNKTRMSKEHAMKYMRALYAHAGDKSGEIYEIESDFKALPDGHWIAFYSNNFEDLTGEFFPERAIDQSIQTLDQKQYPMPRLFFWHIPWPIGQADWIDRVGHTVVAVGHYENLGGDKEIYDGFRKYFKETDDQFMVSHGYVYKGLDKADDAYERFLTFEISPIPVEDGISANVLTVFKEIEEVEKSTMNVTKEKRAKLEEILGPEAADRLLQLAQKYSDEIEELRLKYKEGDKKHMMSKDEMKKKKMSEDMMDEEEPETEGESEPEKKGETEPETKKKKKETEPEAEAKTETPPVAAPAQPDVAEITKRIVQKLSEQISDQITQQISQKVSPVNEQVKTLETSVKDLSDFVKLQFSVAEAASKSEKTLTSDKDPQVATLITGNKGDQTETNSPLRAMFPMFFDKDAE